MRPGIVLLLLGAAAGLQDKTPRAPEFSGAIDRLLQARWTSIRAEPAPVADDAAFLRRLSLDLRGFPPGGPEARAFLADASPAKRLAKIDEYLAGPDFAALGARWLVSILFDNFGGLSLQLPGRTLVPATRDRLRTDFLLRLEAFVAADPGIPSLLQDLLEARGRTEENPLLLYKLSMWDGDRAHLRFAERISQSWLGIRVSCARCHDHPFDRWTQEDFYGLSAFFNREKPVLSPEKGDATEAELREQADAPELTMPDSERPLKPSFLYGGAPGKNDPRMTALALFLARKDHNQLARNFANRIWAWLMGRGVVHPVDDFTQRNRPSVPDLLETLTREFVAGRQTIKGFVRAICASKAYQRSSSGGDERDHARGAIRPLTAGQLFFAAVAAGRGPELAGKRDDPAVRAWWTRYGDEMKLVFGPGVPWTETTPLPGNARQMLMIRNSALFREWIAGEGGIARRLAADEARPAAARIEEAYLSILSRPPNREEQARWGTWLEGRGPDEAFEDLAWTLMNSTEFLTRH